MRIVPRGTGLRRATPELPSRSTWNISRDRCLGPPGDPFHGPGKWQPRLRYLGKPRDRNRWDPTHRPGWTVKPSQVSAPCPGTDRFSGVRVHERLPGTLTEGAASECVPSLLSFEHGRPRHHQPCRRLNHATSRPGALPMACDMKCPKPRQRGLSQSRAWPGVAGLSSCVRLPARGPADPPLTDARGGVFHLPIPATVCLSPGGPVTSSPCSTRTSPQRPLPDRRPGEGSSHRR